MLDGIRDLGYGVYLVGRTPVRIAGSAIDMSTRDGVADIRRLAQSMGDGPRGIPYGALTAMTVRPKADGPNGPKYVRELHRFRDLPDPVRAALRKEFPEYAAEI